jgi:5-methylcytosine-specific restriction endonuclease McrA
VFVYMGICERCGDPLSNNQSRWCSSRCSRLGLKSLYRKRNLEKIKAYNRVWRRAKNGGNAPLPYPAEKRERFCLRCGSRDDLQLAHVKPIGAGGIHRYVITLCRTCHHLFDNLLRDFWYKV